MGPAAALAAVAALAGRAARRRPLRRVAAVTAALTSINEGHARRLAPDGDDPAEIAGLLEALGVTLDHLERERGFAGDVAHELRRPITALRTELEDAISHPDETDVPTLAARLLPCADRLEAMVADLLLLARTRVRRAGHRERFDLGERVHRELKDRADHCQVSLDIASHVTVEAVPAEISRVLANLLDNAQRYARGNVGVEVGRRGAVAVLAVSDDGVGVPEPDRQRIFERFTRLGAYPERDGAGSGLGLAIVDEIARAHEGGVHVEDSPSGGACFVFMIPLAA
ncbi:hypothetical protein Skr01_60360 [Sphaerisporangium krabiense]|uniref:histidine kinase n=1 Tax=Sphaerisporangium krabiense TaxID=763782 RepID=A0A7W8ZBN0_9ACTN|nr:HAMP domain-containing sensor histidine kinase [Sphaerisporangium krabiense]MBB5631068.1 signal transduction histidine kinase [Sphaerisporangium krabiense]GII65951.1 hypothetical protein Skr01_60360 [Sphaerisporangium krabiense]